MNTRKWIPYIAVATLALTAGLAGAQGPQPGGRLPKFDLDDMAQTGAKSVDEFAGRAVLIEFFAFW
jgi:hypothetical protein